MASNLASYNEDVLAIKCRKCGALPRKRCMGNTGAQPTAAHTPRLRDAGYMWDRKTLTLIPIWY